MERKRFEAHLGAWAEGLLGEPPDTVGSEDAIALDGKALRGSQKQGAAGAHRLSALAHRVGLTLAQQAVDDKTNESPVALALLRHMVLEGRIVTRHCQVVEAETLIRQVGASPRSYSPFRQPAPYLSFQPNSRIAAASLRGIPTLIADAVWGGSIGQWGHTRIKIAGHVPLT